MFEKSDRSGLGLTVDSKTPFHLNISGALLLTVEDTIQSFLLAIKDLSETNDSKKKEKKKPSSDVSRAIVDQRVLLSQGVPLKVKHQIPRPLESDEKVAFSFFNLSGQRLRIHQDSGGGSIGGKRMAFIMYVEHGESKRLHFEATVSVVKNMEFAEVPFPGLPHSKGDPR